MDNLDFITFTDDAETTEQQTSQDAWKVLVVDDEQSIHDMTKMVLKDFTFNGQSLTFTSAYSAEDAKNILQKQPDFALILLDVVMENDTAGLDLVKYIRTTLHNNNSRIVLRTGQPGQAPEQEVVRDYDINDYINKAEITVQKLYTVVTASFRGFRDICLLEKQRKVLDESQKKFKAIFNHTFEFVLMLNKDGDIIEINEAALDGFNANENSIVGKKYWELPWWEEDKGKQEYVKKTLEKVLKKDFIRFETEYTKANNETGYLDFSLKAVRNPNGDVFMILAEGRDISERYQMESDKSELNKQLSHAQKMESIGMLAGGIAHDFNNIIFSIIGNAELMQMDFSEEEENYELTDSIVKTAMKGSQLIRKLLSFSRREEDIKTPCDFYNIAIEAIDLLKPSCKKVKISLKTSLENHSILGLKHDLENAIINLGLNARDAMPTGGTLEIKIDYPESIIGEISSKKYLCLSVTDNGTGIEKEIIDEIFEPLFTTKEAGKGTGFGLSSVYACMKNHNGVVEVSSKIGKGTKFELLLPLSEQQSLLYQNDETILIKKENIAILTNDQVMLEFSKNIINDLGYHTTTFTSCDEMLKFYKYNEEHYDLLLLGELDQHNSVEDFISLTQDTNILLMANQIDADKLSETQLPVLMKPLSPKKLCLAISEILEKGTQNGQ